MLDSGHDGLMGMEFRERLMQWWSYIWLELTAEDGRGKWISGRRQGRWYVCWWSHSRVERRVQMSRRSCCTVAEILTSCYQFHVVLLAGGWCMLQLSLNSQIQSCL